MEDIKSRRIQKKRKRKRNDGDNIDMDSKHCDNIPSKNEAENLISERMKMPLSQRAKQFAPFQALSMLSIALKQVEDEHEKKVNTEYYEKADAKHEKK